MPTMTAPALVASPEPLYLQRAREWQEAKRRRIGAIAARQLRRIRPTVNAIKSLKAHDFHAQF